MDQKEQIVALARKFAEIFNEYPQVIPYAKDLQLKFDSFIEDEVCTVSMGATDVYIGTNPIIITKDLFISPGKFIDAFIEEYTLKYDVLCDNLGHYIEKAH